MYTQARPLIISLTHADAAWMVVMFVPGLAAQSEYFQIRAEIQRSRINIAGRLYRVTTSNRS